jgi:hypothetical protein
MFLRAFFPQESGRQRAILSYDGAKVDSRSVVIIDFADEREGCAALDKIDVKISVDQVLGH